MRRLPARHSFGVRLRSTLSDVETFGSTSDLLDEATMDAYIELQSTASASVQTSSIHTRAAPEMLSKSIEPVNKIV